MPADGPRLALIAHDGKKADLLAFVTFNRDRLRQCRLVATRSTGELLASKAGLDVDCVESGPLGGDAQIAAQVVEGRVDAVIFIVDPLDAHPHDPDIRTLLRNLQRAWRAARDQRGHRRSSGQLAAAVGRIGLIAIVAPDQAVSSDVRLGRTKLRRTKGSKLEMSYDMLEPGQGTFVLRRWLHVSGAEPVKRPDRWMELLDRAHAVAGSRRGYSRAARTLDQPADGTDGQLEIAPDRSYEL